MLLYHNSLLLIIIKEELYYEMFQKNIVCTFSSFLRYAYGVLHGMFQ